jgi:hypothetical protein
LVTPLSKFSNNPDFWLHHYFCKGQNVTFPDTVSEKRKNFKTLGKDYFNESREKKKKHLPVQPK